MTNTMTLDPDPANTMTLDPDPASNNIMLSVQDDDEDLSCILWNGNGMAVLHPPRNFRA
jgi:hypothetical protein